MKPLPAIPAGADMLLTTYTCAAYLARLGIIEGEIVYDEVRPKRVYVADIQRRVAERFEIPVAEMKSARRAREVARPRQVAMYLSKRHTARSLPEIGRSFGDRDHTTVIHAVRRITELRMIDHELNAAIKDVEASL